MVHKWLDAYPGARDYLQWCADQVIQGNYLETPYGRRRRFGLVTKMSLHGLQNEARNFAIQSASSDTTLVAAMAMEKDLLATYDTKIINLVHDSILLEVPADISIIEQVALYAGEVMRKVPIDLFNCPIPFNTDFEIGKNWGELVGYIPSGVDNCVFKEINGKDVYTPFGTWYSKVMEEYK